MFRTYHKTLFLKTGLLLLPAFLLFLLPKLQAQQNNFPGTKTEQVDTLWGKNNSTPDSVVYNIFSRPDIVKTYGKEGDNPNLDWENLTSSEKAAYFTKAMQKFIKTYPQYDVVGNTGDTVLKIGSEPCSTYTLLAIDNIEGVNYISADTVNQPLNKYSNLKTITEDSVANRNIPVQYVSATENGEYNTPHFLNQRCSFLS